MDCATPPTPDSFQVLQGWQVPVSVQLNKWNKEIHLETTSHHTYPVSENQWTFLGFVTLLRGKDFKNQNYEGLL